MKNGREGGAATSEARPNPRHQGRAIVGIAREPVVAHILPLDATGDVDPLDDECDIWRHLVGNIEVKTTKGRVIVGRQTGTANVAQNLAAPAIARAGTDRPFFIEGGEVETVRRHIGQVFAKGRSVRHGIGAFAGGVRIIGLKT